MLCHLRLAIAADTIDIQREAILPETLQVQVLNRLDNLRRPELRHLPAHRTYLMAMAVVVVTRLVFRDSLKAMADDQAQLQEKIQCVIDRRPTDDEKEVIDQLLIQFLEREVTVDAVDGFQDGVALWRLAMIIHLKIVIQNPFYSRQNTFFHPRKIKNRTKVRIFGQTKESLFIKNLN